ncbi:Crp/Fnr family transcriptional regulator [Aurantiacibacter suaedae]|uniref:Crp/Fnr family transcriptional regulator n=1 Tax=Aurantiacibacter suaedae TaxID=2545755 RepID=UPI0010F4C96C|nr:Crp/Fnr family transcriptional regulator [Aurantiacibacter suaedae]
MRTFLDNQVPAPAGGAAPDISRFLATIRQRFTLSEHEGDLIASQFQEVVELNAGDYIAREGQKIGFCSLILDGFAARFKETAAGERQIMEVQIPGDFVDLHSYPLEVLDHSIAALTPCKVARLPHRALTQLIEDHPRFARILWFATMVDASMHREWLLNIGTRNGMARIAHLMCEIYSRSQLVGLTEGGKFRFPLSQTQIGECLGYTQMHVNRMLKKLRQVGVIAGTGQVVEILDWEGLQRLAEFDPAYLYLSGREG